MKRWDDYSTARNEMFARILAPSTARPSEHCCSLAVLGPFEKGARDRYRWHRVASTGSTATGTGSVHGEGC
ncbi:MAG: hypothetical protein AB7K73_02640 [Gammaproteobacteria bacterium]